MSVGGAPALEFEVNSFHLSHLDGPRDDPAGYEDYLDLPAPTKSDLDVFENRVLPTTDQFDHFLNHVDHDHDLVFDEYQFDEFLNHDDPPAPEIQSADPLAEKTASLQPPFGASTSGCDGGHVAVSV